MKWCRFSTGGPISYGIIEGETVTEVDGTPFGSYAKTPNTHKLDAVKLEVPVIPPTFYAAGINYPEHVTWAAQMRGEEPVLPTQADVGYRAINALVPDGHDIIVPKDATEMLQYEGELVVVIGKTCRNVTEEQALDYVLGYSIGNDVSERTWQRGDRTMGEYDVASAIFGVRTFISKMSQYLTLVPGDILWMGTDGATENMVDGDVCTISINDIGTLTNKVNWQKPA